MDAQTLDDQAAQDFSHAALLYRGTESLLGALTDFAEGGLSAGEPVLLVLPETNLQLAQRALGSRNGHLRYEEMSVLGANPSRLLCVYQDWIDAHQGPVRVIGESVFPGRSYAETVECLRHEALLNHELASCRASLLCPYDAERLEGHAIAGAELTHPYLICDGGPPQPSQTYGEPLEVAKASRWPQTPPVEPVTEHPFDGDLRSLRHAVADDPIAAPLDRERRSDLVFVVNEAATNAVKHGNGRGRARLWREGGSVVSEVITDSVLEDAFAGRRRPAAHSPSGRGLWLINQICDLVELRSAEQGTTLRMHLRVAA